MIGPVYNTIYPWSTDNEPPLILYPVPKTFDEAEGVSNGVWWWGKNRPTRLENQPDSMLRCNGFAKERPYYAPPLTAGHKESLMDRIHWSKDEYTRFQFCPTDTQATWDNNEKHYKLACKKRQQAIDKGNWGEDWKETKFQRDWGYRDNYSIDEMLYTVNSYGFRADCFKKTKHSNKKKVMTLGCSFAFGIGVRDNENFASIISKELNAVNWNLGVGGSSPKLAMLLSEHMFRIGYVPDIVCCNWSIIARNVLANKTKFEKMLDVPTNHFVDEKSLKERQEQWKSIAESDDYSDLGSFRNQEGLHFPDLNPQKEDNTYHTNQTWGYHPQDINAPFNIRDLNNLLNTIKNTDTFQAQIRLNRTEQELLDFNHLRTKLVYMCEAYGVKLYETFYDASAHRLALDLYKTEPYWRSGIPFHTGSLKLDMARDGSHWGPKSHEVVANHFLKLIREDK